MGGVIATLLASKYNEVKKLVLVAPSFSHIEKEEGSLLKATRKIPSIIKAYSFSEFETRIKKLPVTALKEFFDLVEQYQFVYKDVDIPVMILHGSKDQMVPIDTTRRIFDELKNNHKEYVTIKNYYHDVFNGKKLHIINNEIIKFLKTPTFLIKEKKIEI
jgi:esterase/lipase